ncbi:ATP synthase F1 subunit epsilon [Candidatus Woesebacteria bacterium]|nr:ATP synthase F1 subunit epsilon [Candidatus Woesebacteria bacterium]
MPLKLTIVTQEKELLNQEVESVTAMTTTGEVTILPSHIPLMTKLSDGELTYRIKGTAHIFAVTGGFMNVEPDNKVIVLADSAVRSEDINEARAEAARKRAYDSMQNQKLSKTEMQIAEGELRKAILELKVSRKRRSGA